MQQPDQIRHTLAGIDSWLDRLQDLHPGYATEGRLLFDELRGLFTETVADMEDRLAGVQQTIDETYKRLERAGGSAG